MVGWWGGGMCVSVKEDDQAGSEDGKWNYTR